MLVPYLAWAAGRSSVHNQTDEAAIVFFILGLVVLVLLFIWCKLRASRHLE